MSHCWSEEAQHLCVYLLLEDYCAVGQCMQVCDDAIRLYVLLKLKILSIIKNMFTHRKIQLRFERCHPAWIRSHSPSVCLKTLFILTNSRNWTCQFKVGANLCVEHKIMKMFRMTGLSLPMASSTLGLNQLFNTGTWRLSSYEAILQ